MHIVISLHHVMQTVWSGDGWPVWGCDVTDEAVMTRLGLWWDGWGCLKLNTLNTKLNTKMKYIQKMYDELTESWGANNYPYWRGLSKTSITRLNFPYLSERSVFFYFVCNCSFKHFMEPSHYIILFNIVFFIMLWNNDIVHSKEDYWIKNK